MSTVGETLSPHTPHKARRVYTVCTSARCHVDIMLAYAVSIQVHGCLTSSTPAVHDCAPRGIHVCISRHWNVHSAYTTYRTRRIVHDVSYTTYRTRTRNSQSERWMYASSARLRSLRRRRRSACGMRDGGATADTAVSRRQP